MRFLHVFLHAAPSPPSHISFADVTNTSLAITWKGPPDWTDYDDFDLQWFPRDAITVFNPYSNRKSEGRIVYGLRPGRSYQFSVKTVSGDSWKTYSKPVSGSVRTSMTCFATLGSQMEWGGICVAISYSSEVWFKSTFLLGVGLIWIQPEVCVDLFIPWTLTTVGTKEVISALVECVVEWDVWWRKYLAL